MIWLLVLILLLQGTALLLDDMRWPEMAKRQRAIADRLDYLRNEVAELHRDVREGSQLPEPTLDELMAVASRIVEEE